MVENIFKVNYLINKFKSQSDVDENRKLPTIKSVREARSNI